MDEAAYVPIEQFPLKWRFAEDAAKWTVLPPADLAQFRPLSADVGEVLWHKYVWPAGKSLAPPEFAAEFEPVAAKFRTGDDWSSAEENERVAAYLCQQIHVAPASKVLFFWGAGCAAETTWDLLLRYWSDFCYPSDDLNVAIVLESDLLILYEEGIVWLARPRADRSSRE